MGAVLFFGPIILVFALVGAYLWSREQHSPERRWVAFWEDIGRRHDAGLSLNNGTFFGEYLESQKQLREAKEREAKLSVAEQEDIYPDVQDHRRTIARLWPALRQSAQDAKHGLL